MSLRPGLDLDYAKVFAAVPAACLVLDPQLVIVAAKDAYLTVTARERLENPAVADDDISLLVARL